MEALDVASLILRFALGSVFLAHGIKHARGRQKTTNWFGSIGFRQPGFQWLASTATEIGVGVLLLAGALTTLAAAGIIGVMFVAYWTVHRHAGYWVTARPDEGWEYVFTLSLAALALAILGPGTISIDDPMGVADAMNEGTGALVALLGVPVAALQLAAFYRPGDVR